MKITKLNISNKFIKYENITLNFSKTGIYKITGSNGTGKTTIIEQIVFGNYNVEFQDDSYYNTWKNNRYNLFTYIPQKIYEYNLTVGEYICKGNKQISLESCEKLLNDFDLDKSILKTKFNVLSGGEKKKIQIITGILKNTPYIFIDEPSNNLDNSSVECLNKVLANLSQDHVIILISHDERINININTEYIIDGKNVNKKENHEIENKNKCFLSRFKKNYFFTILKTIKSFAQIFTIIYLAFIISFLVFYSYKYFSENFYKQKYFDTETILVRNSYYFDADLNDDYIIAEKLDVDKESLGKNIKWIYIRDDISKLKGINDIYLIDEMLNEEIVTAIYYNTLLENKIIISYPSNCYYALNKYTEINYLFANLEGNVPQDYQKQVALSKNVLIKYYGYTEDNVSDAIGNQIYIEEYDSYYTIVGFTYYDYINISYEKEHNNLVYHYQDNTYEDFLVNYYLKLEEIYGENSWTDHPYELVLAIDKKSNEEITNYIFLNYPCVEVISSSFEGISVRFANKQTFNTYLIINIIFSSIFAIALFFTNRSTIKYNYNILEDFGIYYINKKKILNLYKIILVSIMLLVVGILLIVNSLIDRYAYYTNIYIIIDSLILLLPIVIYLFCYKGKRS